MGWVQNLKKAVIGERKKKPKPQTMPETKRTRKTVSALENSGLTLEEVKKLRGGK